MSEVTPEEQRKRIKSINKLLNRIITDKEPELTEDEVNLVIKALQLYRAVIKMDMAKKIKTDCEG